MKITRGRISARNDGQQTITAHCLECGGRFTALADHQPGTGVHHRCARGACGPIWTLVQAPAPARALTTPAAADAA